MINEEGIYVYLVMGMDISLCVVNIVINLFPVGRRNVWGRVKYNNHKHI